jgi:hypothetical protein
MNKEFITYKLALELKQLGFDEPCFGYYLCRNSAFGIDDLLITTEWIDLLPYDSSSCKAPTYSQAFRWFREKHKLSCSIELTDNSRHYYFDFTIYDSKNRDYNDEDCFDSCKRIYDDGKFGTYEEAELECIKKLIEIVKEIKNE